MSDAAYRLVRTSRPPADPPVLDDAQRAVVEHPGGPLLVLAGPGTGKTTTLVETVVARADAGVPVESMLMLTFSRRAAQELRDRVAARLGRTVREPVARTLHSYAFGVVRMAAVRRREPTPRLLTASEQDVVIRDLLADGDAGRWPASLRPALRTLGFADELRALLTRAVERGLDGPTLAELGRRHRRADWVAAGAFLTEYQGVTVLRDPGGYDPAELIQAAINALRDDADLLAGERELRRHLFVDEYQDTDPAQLELLQLVSAGSDELVLVGDPDQSIYAFRGADASAIRDVDTRFGDGRPVPVVALRQCRRSGATLLAATRRVASRLPGRREQRAIVPAPGTPPGEVQVSVFRSASEEAAYVAGELRAAHLAGVPWSRMAVLVRSTTASLGTLRRAMVTAGVPVAVAGDDLPLADQSAVTVLLQLIGLSLRPHALDEQFAEQLLTGPIGGADDLYLRRVRRTLRRTVPEENGALVPALRDRLGIEALDDQVRRPLARVAAVLAAGAEAVAENVATEQLLWALWDASGLARRWEAASAAGGAAGAAADRDLDAVVELFRAAADFTDRLPHLGAGEFAAYVAAQQIPGPGASGRAHEPEAVAVLTAHASKGLEWDLVCVAGVQEGRWPDLRRRGSLLGVDQLVDAVQQLDITPSTGADALAPQLAEERRLFYVAATRARRRLVVTAVAGDEEQPSRLLDELDPTDGTRAAQPPKLGVHLPGLVSELRAVVCDAAAADADRRAAAAQLSRLAAGGVPGADPDEWWGLAPLSTEAGAADPDRPVRVGPSRIEQFLTCELRTLLLGLGVTGGESAAADLGTLVHDLAATADPDQTLQEFEARLDARWHEIDFGAAWLSDNQRVRASEMLRRLVDWLRESRRRLEHVASEREFSAQVGDAVISGRVDRLERDQQGRLVVVDLKTGSTKAKDLDRHPQLGAYQLAIAHGGFAGEGTDPGGGELVQLGASGAVTQTQPPLADADDPGWAREQVDHVASRMRGFEFTAIQNDRCQLCVVRTCCPLQPSGRQVP
ncbi:ATP-dependent helicase [Jatrophihabitans fulvus]